MKTTNKTTPTKQEDTPTESKTATTDTHPPSDSPNKTRATTQAKRRITEVSKPVFEIIACFANCAGFPRNVVKPFDKIYSYERIEYIFDLRDNRTGLVYKGLFASKGGEWEDEGFDEYVAVMTEMTEEEQEYLKRQGNEQTDSSCLKFYTFPLRP